MLKSEEFIGWVQDRSSSDFARSKEYKGLVDAIPSEVFNNIVHPFLQQVEEIGGAPELTGAILLFPAMCVDDWALNSAEEYFEMLQYALGTGEPRLVDALGRLCWFIQQDLTEPGYTTSIAHNYGILLEDFCLYEQYREHPLTSDDDYNDPYCDVYKSSFVQLHNLVRLVEPEQMRDVLKEAHEQKLGVVDYCQLKRIVYVPMHWVGDGRRANLYRTYSKIMKDLVSNILTDRIPDFRLNKINDQYGGVHIDELKELPETELYQQGGIFDGTVLYRVQQPNLDIASCWLLLGRVGVELYGVSVTRGFFTLYKKEIQDIIQNRDTESIISLYDKLLDPYMRARRISDKPGAVMFRALSQIGDIGVY